MKATTYLINNFKWAFSKPDYTLVGSPSTKEQLFSQLDNYCNNAKPCQKIKPDCSYVQYLLNQVFLSKATNEVTRHLKSLYFHYNNLLAKAEKVLNNSNPLPCWEGQIVVETLAKNFVVATQGSKQQRLWKDYQSQAVNYLCLSQEEKTCLDAYYNLYLVKYYCTLYKLCKRDSNLLQVANLTNNADLLRHKWIENVCYSRTFYKTSQLFSALDCFCNSATIFGDNRTDTVFNLRCNFNNRNCFDTFLQYKYGKKSANFRTQGNVLDATCQYFCYKNYEVRKYFFTNKSKLSGKLEVVVKFDVGGASATYFQHETASCFAKQNMYVGLLAIVDDKVVSLTPTCSHHPTVVKSKTSLKIPLDVNQSTSVQFVTIYASNVQDLYQTIHQATTIGFTNCFAYSDTFCQGEVSSVVTNVTVGASNLYENSPTSPAKPLKYCYQFGNESVATLVDSNGNNATLLNGFVSSGGEGVYVVVDGKISKINCGSAQIDDNKLVYVSPPSSLDLLHQDTSKIYQITTPKPVNVLFLLPLEECSKVKPIVGGVEVVSASRHFVVKHNGTIQSLTTNALECNPSRLRYKLSGDVSSGNTLAIYFAKTNSLQITLTNLATKFNQDILISDTLSSAYLTACNQKTVFQLSHGMCLPNPFSLIATAYTHPRWLKNYLTTAHKCNCEFAFYNSNGKKRYKQDLLCVYFGALWLALVGFDNQLLNQVLPLTSNLLSSPISIVYKALIVKKLADLQIDKVDNLVLYAQYKKQIGKDKSCYSLAQVVGAVPLNYPSVQRIVDLCKEHNLPKSWQYVANYEILYNLQLHSNKVSVKPVPSARGFVAENFTLNLPNEKVKICFFPAKTYLATYQKQGGKSTSECQSSQINVKY